MDRELATYQASVDSQISYDRKEDYFSLIETYLKGNTSGDEFRSKFLEIEDQDSHNASIILQNFQKLEKFILGNNHEKFSKLLF